MLESCYCGRNGSVEDRKPVLDGEGQRALALPDRGHLERLSWLPEEACLLVLKEAGRRQRTMYAPIFEPESAA